MEIVGGDAAQERERISGCVVEVVLGPVPTSVFDFYGAGFEVGAAIFSVVHLDDGVPSPVLVFVEGEASFTAYIATAESM